MPPVAENPREPENRLGIIANAIHDLDAAFACLTPDEQWATAGAWLGVALGRMPTPQAAGTAMGALMSTLAFGMMKR